MKAHASRGTAHAGPSRLPHHPRRPHRPWMRPQTVGRGLILAWEYRASLGDRACRVSRGGRGARWGTAGRAFLRICQLILCQRVPGRQPLGLMGRGPWPAGRPFMPFSPGKPSLPFAPGAPFRPLGPRKAAVHQHLALGTKPTGRLQQSCVFWLQQVPGEGRDPGVASMLKRSSFGSCKRATSQLRSYGNASGREATLGRSAWGIRGPLKGMAPAVSGGGLKAGGWGEKVGRVAASGS